MSDQGYTQTISTAEFLETPGLALEQPTGDVYIESWDRPEIQVSIKEDGYFEIEQQGSRVEIENRPGRFKLVDFLEQGEDLRNIGEDLRNFGIDIDRMAYTRRAQRGTWRRARHEKHEEDGPQYQR